MSSSNEEATYAADAVIQIVVDKVKHLAEDKLNKNFKEFRATTILWQVVAGTNYFVRVQVDDAEYLHLRIFAPLAHSGRDIELHGVLYPKTESDELKYFERN